MKLPVENEIRLNLKTGSWKYVLRVCLFFTVSGMVQWTNATVSAQTSNISLDLKNVSIEEVLNKIESQTVYRFLYNKQIVDVSRKVTVLCKKKEVTRVLKDVLKDTGIDFSVNGKQIVLTVTQKPDLKRLKKSIRNNKEPIG